MAVRIHRFLFMLGSFCSRGIMKTVLAPGAPWPKYDTQGEVVKPKPLPRKPPPKKSKSRIAHTNAKFIEWAGRNL